MDCRLKSLRLIATLCALSTVLLGPLQAAAPPSRYTFSWPLGSEAPAPRGGTTRGPAVTLDSAPGEAWQALHEAYVPAFERDRRAIQAMAGTYRVMFDFIEVASFQTDAQRQRPYQSWGTEKVYVDSDDGRHISLVHVLEMRVVGEDGKPGEAIVTRHWRQDWRYEPHQLIEYEGGEHWHKRALSPLQVRGQWSQTVYQVDDSPRYAGLGRWEHTGSFSTWVSGETARPLPRREWSVRQDYRLLLGTNRHTIVPGGWLQEENNLKATAPGSPLPYLAREYGVARYERIKDSDFAAADHYYESTRRFWSEVMASWDLVWGNHDDVQLQVAVDQSGAYATLFELADRYAAGELPLGDARAAIRAALESLGVSFR